MIFSRSAPAQCRLRDRFIHYYGSFLLCNIPKDALDDFVLYCANINLLVGGGKRGVSGLQAIICIM